MIRGPIRGSGAPFIIYIHKSIEQMLFNLTICAYNKFLCKEQPCKNVATSNVPILIKISSTSIGSKVLLKYNLQN